MLTVRQRFKGNYFKRWCCTLKFILPKFICWSFNPWWYLYLEIESLRLNEVIRVGPLSVRTVSLQEKEDLSLSFLPLCTHCHVKIGKKMSICKPERTVFREQPCWNPDLDFYLPQERGRKFLLSQPPSLRCYDSLC